SRSCSPCGSTSTAEPGRARAAGGTAHPGRTIDCTSAGVLRVGAYVPADAAAADPAGGRLHVRPTVLMTTPPVRSRRATRKARGTSATGHGNADLTDRQSGGRPLRTRRRGDITAPRHAESCKDLVNQEHPRVIGVSHG